MAKVRSQFQATCKAPSGFSMIELMMAIAFISVFASIALMLYGKLNDTATFQKDRRNAQEIAGVASSASAAGASFIVPGDERATIVNLRNGVAPTTGAFKGRSFIIPGLSDADVTGAMRFLSLRDSDLLYIQVGSGGQ